MNVARNIKRKREQINLTQEQLAELMHVQRQAISKWERDVDYPDLINLVQLTKIFNVSLDMLILGIC